MIKRFLLIFLLDIVLIALWDYWVNSNEFTQGEAMGVVLIVPTLIILSGVIGLILKLRKSGWGNIMLINSIIAFAIFISVFKYEFWKQQHDNYLMYYFSDNAKVYYITLNLSKARLQNGLPYSISERLGEYGSAATDLNGSYEKKDDTIILSSNKGKVMKLFDKTLFDYPQKGGSIILRDNPE